MMGKIHARTVAMIGAAMFCGCQPEPQAAPAENSNAQRSDSGESRPPDRAAAIKQTQINLKYLENMLKLYAAQLNGHYPDDVSRLLKGEVIDGKERKPITDSIPVDAWGRPFHYEWPNTKSEDSVGPAIWSDGLDQQDNGGQGDDINNWTTEEP